MLLSKNSQSFFIMLFVLFSSAITNAILPVDTQKCCSITIGSDNKVSIGSNEEIFKGDLIGTDPRKSKSKISMGDSLVIKKLKQPNKHKLNEPEISSYEHVHAKDRLKITEGFKDNKNEENQVFEFYPSIKDDNFNNDEKTKSSNEQLYKF